MTRTLVSVSMVLVAVGAAGCAVDVGQAERDEGVAVETNAIESADTGGNDTGTPSGGTSTAKDDDVALACIRNPPPIPGYQNVEGFIIDCVNVGGYVICSGGDPMCCKNTSDGGRHCSQAPSDVRMNPDNGGPKRPDAVDGEPGYGTLSSELSQLADTCAALGGGFTSKSSDAACCSVCDDKEGCQELCTDSAELAKMKTAELEPDATWEELVKESGGATERQHDGEGPNDTGADTISDCVGGCRILYRLCKAVPQSPASLFCYNFGVYCIDRCYGVPL